MGQLFLVGAGPGDTGLLAPIANQAIAASSDIVAYGLYLDLLGDICLGKIHHDMPLGKEIERAKLALDLASEGKVTALISSGDIGVFAMATLVFELLDNQLSGQLCLKEVNYDWVSVDIEVIPGISAMQTAACRTGALLGHDFCAISLSNLLTPWETIVRRVRSAGEGDFVVSFYNPVSKKRNWQLNDARDILLEYRPPATPVVLGSNLTRDNESIRIITLQSLKAKDVDMFTLVLIGNSESKYFINNNRSWVYTPRGYSKKL